MKWLIFFLLSTKVVILFSKRKSYSAAECDLSQCQLPECYCSGTAIPNGLKPETIPQIVMLTYDDDVNEENYKYYFKLLNNRTNPNGCPISATFFVSHEYTDYSLVQQLYHDGHEIASHTITHRTDNAWWASATKEDLLQELGGQREILHQLANIKEQDIIGVRAPFLQTSGDEWFQMMEENYFWYDSSYPTRMYSKPPMWPYTLDFATKQECAIPPCPQKSHPGIWEVPLVDFTDKVGTACSMIDSCSRPATKTEGVNFLLDNFWRHYGSNRAPLPVFLHSVWFVQEINFEAMERFLDLIQKSEDVYIVSVKQAIEWIRHPVTLDKIRQFKPWLKCKKPPPTSQRCTNPNTCQYSTNSGERYMRTCQKCPKNYPWFNNPSGDDLSSKT